MNRSIRGWRKRFVRRLLPADHAASTAPDSRRGAGGRGRDPTAEAAQKPERSETVSGRKDSGNHDFAQPRSEPGRGAEAPGIGTQAGMGSGGFPGIGSPPVQASCTRASRLHAGPKTRLRKEGALQTRIGITTASVSSSSVGTNWAGASSFWRPNRSSFVFRVARASSRYLALKPMASSSPA